MKATIVQLADDVVEQLNKKQGGWAVGFEAVRKYQPKYEFEQLATMQVQVVPMTWSYTLDNRGQAYGWKNEYVIGIGLFYRPKPGAGDQATSRFDECVRLVEQVTDYWKEQYRTNTQLSNCSLTGVDLGGATGAPYQHEVIETQNQFTSVIQLTFQKYR